MPNLHNFSLLVGAYSQLDAPLGVSSTAQGLLCLLGAERLDITAGVIESSFTRGWPAGTWGNLSSEGSRLVLLLQCCELLYLAWSCTSQLLLSHSSMLLVRTEQKGVFGPEGECFFVAFLQTCSVRRICVMPIALCCFRIVRACGCNMLWPQFEIASGCNWQTSSVVLDVCS